MSRPFSQTLQAHELDVHRLWLVLILLSSLLLLVWAGWASVESIVVYEHADKAVLTERSTRAQTVEEQGNVYRVRTWRQRWLQVSFPGTARGKLRPGQQAVVSLRGEAAPTSVAAVVAEVHEEGAPASISALLRVDQLEESVDPFAHAVPERVKVAVDSVAPISLLLSGRNSASGSQLQP